MPGRNNCPSRMSYRSIGPPAFLAGVAAACLDGVFRDIGALTDQPNGLALATWVVIGLIASFGAARVTTQWASDSTPRPPSMMGCAIACALGGMAVVLLPDGWLRLLGGAGFILMLYLALGLLAGLVDMASRINRRLPIR